MKAAVALLTPNLVRRVGMKATMTIGLLLLLLLLGAGLFLIFWRASASG